MLPQRGAIDRAKATKQSHNVSTSLPAGLTLTRASGATYYNADLGAVSVSANVARYGYDPESKVLRGMRIEPASQNSAQNSGGIAASDLSSFNTTTGSNAGTWGTLPSGTSIIVPSLVSGSTSGWQVTAKGNLADGQPYTAVRLKYHNGRSSGDVNGGAVTMRYVLTAFAGVPAASGQEWSSSVLLSIMAGGLTPLGGLRMSMRGVAIGSTVFFEEDPQDTPAAYPEMSYHTISRKIEGVGIDRVSPTISIVIRAGETLDVTLLIAHRQIEQQPQSTSYIATSATPVSRSADALHATVTPGLWFVRWKSHYRNFDVAISTATTDLVLTCPSEALRAGILQFEGIEISSEPFAPDTKRLCYAPPALGSYVHVTYASRAGGSMPTAVETSPIDGLPYGTNTGGQRYYENNVDVIVIMPEGGVTGNLKIIGGRTVRIIGGKFTPSDAEGYLNADLRFMLTMAGQSEAVFIEGVLFDGDNSEMCLDAFRVSGVVEVAINPRPLKAPDVYFQNVRADNIKGRKTPNVDHADVFQVTSPIGRIFMDRVTGYSSYQGIFVPNVNRLIIASLTEGDYPIDKPVPAMYITGRRFSRINIAYKLWQDPDDNGSAFWLANTPYYDDPRWPGINIGDEFACPTQLFDCYSVQHDGKPWSNSFWPPPDGGGFTDDQKWFAQVAPDGQSVAYNVGLRIRGCIHQGAPAGGDYVPLDQCGDNYKSPGYGYEP